MLPVNGAWGPWFVRGLGGSQRYLRASPVKPCMEWDEFFRSSFQEVKRRLAERYKLEDDGSGPPTFVALRDMIDKLPCPVRVVELRFDRTRHPHLHQEVCPVIAYDLTNLGRGTVQALGVVDAYDHAKVVDALTAAGLPLAVAQSFADELQGDAKIIASLETVGPHVALQFVFDDPRKDPDDFVWGLTMLLEDWLETILPPVEATDYLALYNLQPLRVLSRQKLLAAHPSTRSFVRWTEKGFQPLTLDELQHRVSRELLIPNVPEAAQRVFARARDLYVFGYFRYEFFTVAQHQAALALEVAIKHRYCQALGDTVTLRTWDGEEIVLHRPDYDRLWRVLKEAKRRLTKEARKRPTINWASPRASALTVNGAPFRASVPELLAWLVEKKIITMWERNVCEHYRHVRNWLSHPLYGSVLPPGYALSAIRDVARLTNKMFHGVKTA